MAVEESAASISNEYTMAPKKLVSDSVAQITKNWNMTIVKHMSPRKSSDEKKDQEQKANYRKRVQFIEMICEKDDHLNVLHEMAMERESKKAEAEDCAGSELLEGGTKPSNIDEPWLVEWLLSQFLHQLSVFL